jgi:ADP-L-glycero-D-manno-heptose 6-epimerase
MILVTGGAGFIGSNMVAALGDRGRRVVVCDRLRTGDKWRNIAKAELCDLVAPETLHEWLDANGGRVEAVVHMGAISATTETDVDLIVEVNFRLSWKLWQWCAAHCRPLIYASSAATYGGGERGFVDDPDLLPGLRPLNAYGWSKHLFDRRVLRAVADGEPVPPQWAGLKFFNVYGPNEYHKGSMMSVIAQKYSAAAAGESIALFKSHRPDYADGGQKRDFVFVRDCVDVMLWLLEHKAVSGLFNLGSGEARTFEDLAVALFRACGQEPRIEYVDMPEMLQGKYQYFTEANMERLRRAGYSEPFTSLEQGVTDYVENYLSASDRYR